jgi:hypothetical protein
MVERAGPESGDVFDDIEEQAEQMGREATRDLIGARLEAEEARQGEDVACPECGRPMRRPPTAGERALDTASGGVRYRRRHALCDRCRNSFSPAGPPVEDPPSGAVGPPPAQGV